MMTATHAITGYVLAAALQRELAATDEVLAQRDAEIAKLKAEREGFR